MLKSGISKRLLGTISSSLGTCVLLGITLVPANAQAKACVIVDESRDNLSPEDRKGAALLFEEALRDSHKEIGAEGDCDDPYTIYNIRLGTTLTVVARNKTTERKERVASESELADIYSQIVRAMDQGIANTAEGTAVTRNNVTQSQTMPPRRMASDGYFYLRMGLAGTHAQDARLGPAFGLGGRWALAHLAVDASFLNFSVYRNSERGEGVGLNWARLGAYYFLDAEANHSPYFGGAVGLTSQWLPRHRSHDGDWGGGGLNVDLTAGYEFLRASAVRLFTEANFSIPTYRLSASNWSGTSDSTSYAYAPQLTLSVGIGFGRAH